MTTLSGTISSLNQAQFEGFFGALEMAPNVSAELDAFADALDLGFLNGSQTVEEVSLTPTSYVLNVWNQTHTVQLGTVTYTGTGFNSAALGDTYVANDVFGVGSMITGISMVNLSGHTLWNYTGSMNIVQMAGGEVTQGSFNVTELRMGSPGVGVEMVLSGNLTVTAATGTTGNLSGTITGLTQYVRLGGEAYKISITGNLTPTADLIQDAMGDITSTTSNMTGAISGLAIDRLTYSDAAGQTQSGTSNLVTLGNLDLTPADLESLMFAMENPLGPDMSFSDDGIATTPVTVNHDFVSGVAIQADGKILVGGTVGGTAISAPDRFAMVRYNTDGTPDTGFGTGGVFISDPLANTVLVDAVVLPDGKILFAGSFMGDMGSGSGQHSVLGRFTSSGGIDTTFSTGGADGDGFSVLGYETSPFRAMAVQSDGQILTAGDGFTLHRFSATGVLDTTFGGTGTVVHGEPTGTEMASDMVIQGDGKFLVGGTDITTGNFVVARFNADGSLDTGFDGDGWAIATVGMSSSRLAAMTLQADGKVVLVGTATNAMGDDIVVARLNANGTVDSSFGFGSGKAYGGIFNAADHATSVLIDPLNNDIVVGGSSGSTAMVWRFGSFGGGPAGGYGSSATPLETSGMGGVFVARQSDGALVLATSQGMASSGMDFAVTRVVDSNMTMDQILFGGNDNLALTTDVGIEMSGFTGNDTLTGGTGNDTLQGGQGDDSIVGGSGNDRLMGDDGLDMLVGGAGNDTLLGGLGNDTLNGGTESDTADYSFATAGISITLSGGGASGVVDTLGGTDTLISIENIYGSTFNDTLTGDVNANRLDGSIGNDSLNGGDGNDTLVGGMGADTLVGGNHTDLADYSADQNANSDRLGVVVNLSAETLNKTWFGVSFNVASGQAQDGWAQTDTLSEIENITGSTYNDVLFGSTGNNLINGGAGSDLLAGLDGSDTLDGGNDSDIDYVAYRNTFAGVNVNLGTGMASGGAGNDILRNINGVVGSDFNDTLTGGTSSADFRGFRQELFNGLLGDDIIDGGRGTATQMGAGNLEMNMAVYVDALGPVTVNLAAGTASGDGNDTLIGINAVRGSNSNDTLIGGNAIFDFAEWFEGGAGDDSITGGSGRDFVMFTQATSGVNVSLAAGTASGDASVGADTLSGIEGVIGSDYNDTMIGGTEDNFFQGRKGNDSITVGAGVDTVDYSADQNANGDNLGVVVNLSSGTQNNAWQGVSFNVASGLAQDGWGNFDTFTDRGNIENIRGSMYNDFLIGNGLGNNINGGDGADLLIGNSGNDTLDGGTVGDSKYQDWVSYLGAAANTAISPTAGVSVNLGSGTASGFAGSVDSDTLLNIDGVTGSNFDDTLMGGSSSTDFRGMKQEFFNGRSGNDSINGGRANDAVAMDASNFEMNFAMYHETTGFGVNVNLLTGTAAGNGGTNASVGADTLTGINAVRGSNFADVLTGGNSLFDYAEFFEGDGGNDTINGGTGNDYVMYRSAPTGVTVDLANGTALDGKGGTDTLTGIENVVGSDYDDLIKGDAGNNIFQGRKGSDSFDGGAGTDTMDYSADQDDNGDNLGVVVNLSGATQATSWQGVSFNVLSGQALDGWGNTDFFLNRDSFENIRGSIYNDFLVGNGFDNEIIGGKGSDLLVGLTGNDTLDGGTVGPDSGSDWVSYSSAGVAGVTVDLAAGTAVGKPGSTNIGSDILRNIDGVAGTVFADDLKGGSDSSDFKGFKQEFFVGYAGNDIIDGGRAEVSMDASNLEMNMAMYHQTTGTVGVNVNLHFDTVLHRGQATGPAGIVDTDTLIGINAVRGSNNDDALTGGNPLFDYVEFFEGAGGNDVIDGGSGFDYAMYTTATSGVNVSLIANTATGDASVGTDTLVSIEGVIGSGFSDTIIGGAGNEKIQGRKGNDVLDGGAGTDWAYYDGEQDDNGDGLGVTVNLATGLAIDGWAGIDTLVNFENIRGSIYSDSLTGDSNDNLIWGQGGNDSLTGGGGVDVAVFSGTKAGYSIVKVAPGQFTVTDTNTSDGNDGIDSLSGIEKLQFGDGVVSLGKPLVNDFAGDGKSAILWAHPADGIASLWTMNGTAVNAYANYALGAGWKPEVGRADYNGDGKVDLLWSNTGTGSAALWTMNGTAITSYANYTLGSGWETGSARSDFDADGKTDLLWMNSTSGSASLWVMNGTAVTSYANYAMGPGWKLQRSEGDFNGDGKTDLLWANESTGSASLWTMNGAAVGTYANYTMGAGWGVVGNKGDYNGDGKTDLLWANSSTGSASLWTMSGTAILSYANYTMGAGWKLASTNADYNGDGNTDLLWVNEASGSAAIWTMNGTTVGPYANFTLGSGWAPLGGSGDFNGDGKTDLLWGNATTGSASLWTMNGTAVTTYANYTLGAGWKLGAIDGDHNSDGNTDLLWTNEASGSTSLWLMNGTAITGYANYTMGAGWSPVTEALPAPVIAPVEKSYADYSGDGKADFLWGNSGSGSASLWTMNGTTVTSYANFTMGSGWSTVASKGDYNGDGKTDLLWADSANGNVSLWTMNGVSVTSYANFAMGAGWTPLATQADYNGDGKTDLLWVNGNGSASLWTMNGTAVTSYANFVMGTGWTPLALKADYNGDGNSDLLWQNTSTGSTSLWQMNGTAVTGYANFTMGAGWTAVATAGDYNGDNKTDLLWENASTGSTSLWIMNGTGISSYANFTMGAGWAPVASKSDFNGDGNTDLLWANSGSGSASVWTMSGTGITSYANFTMGAGWVPVASSGDYNGDGNSDLLWANTATGSASLWTMNGTGITSYANFTMGSGWAPVAEAADYNGDGNTDLLWSRTSDGSAALWNMNGTAVTSYANYTLGAGWVVG